MKKYIVLEQKKLPNSVMGNPQWQFTLVSPRDDSGATVKTKANAMFAFLLNSGMKEIWCELELRRGKLVMVNARAA